MGDLDGGQGAGPRQRLVIQDGIYRRAQYHIFHLEKYWCPTPANQDPEVVPVS